MAAAALLQGFELVEVFDEDAVEVGLVALDLLDGAPGEDAVDAAARAAETALKGTVFVEEELRGREGVALEADEAVEAPERQGDAMGKDGLKLAFGAEGLELAGDVSFPVLHAFDLGDDGVGGEKAVACGVECGRGRGFGRAAATAGDGRDFGFGFG